MNQEISNKAGFRLSQVAQHINNDTGNDSLQQRVSQYSKIHGQVSRAPAQYFQITQVNNVVLDEVNYYKARNEGIAKVEINREHKRNAFTPFTVKQMIECMNDARDDQRIGVIILTGKGLDAFCSGGDQSVRGHGGYQSVGDEPPRLNVLDLQVIMRRLPKPIVAQIAGYAVGGGQILQMMADISIAGDNAVFGQTGPKVGSFDAGYGCSQMARLVGQKKSREIWFLCRLYNAQDALDMGLINHVVPTSELEIETLVWCREILRNSPTALRFLKASLNAVEDGQSGLSDLGGAATSLFYKSDEGNEGRRSFLEKRQPDFSQFDRLP